MTARLLDITPDEYHADPAPKPSLSSSIAQVLLERSPRHAWYHHPRLGKQPSSVTDVTELGTLIHKLILGKGPDIVGVDADDWRTKRAREERADARKAGKLPVLKRLQLDAEHAAEQIAAQLAERGVALTGCSEVPIMWQEESAHGPTWCRAMVDHVDGLALFDLKTTASAHPEYCMRSAIKYGYDIQQEAYTRALEALYPEHAGRFVFRFLFVEPEPPYGVLIAELDSLMRERGRRRWREAVETWAQCLARHDWPGYSRQPVTLQSPGWLLTQESEAAFARGEVFEI